MSGRATAELVADLRDGNGTGIRRQRLEREAADRLAELDAEVAERLARFLELQESAIQSEKEWDRIDALCLPCPTCGGTAWLNDERTGYGVHQGRPCPDCPDGKITHERAWRLVTLLMTVDPDRHDFPTQQALLDYLRGTS